MSKSLATNKVYRKSTNTKLVICVFIYTLDSRIITTHNFSKLLLSIRYVHNYNIDLHIFSGFSVYLHSTY